MEEVRKPYSTARTSRLLAGELNEFERQEVTAIEEFGCFIVHVGGGSQRYSWSYTVGVYDGCGQPELVTAGLPSATAHSALNDAVRLLRAGTDLTRGRHRELVGEVEVEFRPVDPAWVRELLNSAGWFNGGWDFPVLQLIYPDLENRFQWEQGFTEYFRQPLLQEGVETTRAELDFRASLDPESSLYDWNFPDDPHTQAYLSKSVQTGEEPVTYVSYDADGDWQILGDSMSDGGGPAMECLHHAVDRDKSLKELADLPLGWYAQRDKVGDPWLRRESMDQPE